MPIEKHLKVVLRQDRGHQWLPLLHHAHERDTSAVHFSLLVRQEQNEQDFVTEATAERDERVLAEYVTADFVEIVNVVTIDEKEAW